MSCDCQIFQDCDKCRASKSWAGNPQYNDIIKRTIDSWNNQLYKDIEGNMLFGNPKWQQIKKENMTKRERFLKAGGLFEKEKPQDNFILTTNKTIRLVDINNHGANYNGNVFRLYIIDNNQKYQDKDYPNQKAHFENILSNTKSDTWIASRGREIKIIDLADKHLVNIMRYLVAHWMEIKQQSLIDIDVARNSTKNSRAIVNLNNAYIYVSKIMNPSGLDGTISCFANLIQEFNSRFGYDSLNSIYEGN